MQVGFIGLGIMGEPMAKNILKKSGHPIYVYDVDKSKADNLKAFGANAAESVTEIGEKCNRIFLMLPKSEHVTQVVEQLLPVIQEYSIIVDMSTIDPAVSAELAKKVSAKKADMLDAPVVKSKLAALAGELGIYVGGNYEIYRVVKPLLDCMGKNVIYMGQNGSGLVMKLCHNMLVSQIQNGVNEMLLLAQSCGLNLSDAVTAVSYGGGQNFYLDSKKDTLAAKNFSTNFSVENMHKDVHLALKLAAEKGIELKGLQNAQSVYDAAMEEGLGKEDFSASIKAAWGLYGKKSY